MTMRKRSLSLSANLSRSLSVGVRALLFHTLPGQADRSGRFRSEFAVNHVCRDESQSVAGEFIIPDIILSHVIRENTTFHVMYYNSLRFVDFVRAKVCGVSIEGSFYLLFGT